MHEGDLDGCNASCQARGPPVLPPARQHSCARARRTPALPPLNPPRPRFWQARSPAVSYDKAVQRRLWGVLEEQTGARWDA